MADTQSHLFTRVDEREVKGEIFQVTHRILHIPGDVYQEVVGRREDPFSEPAAQKFVEQYLQWCGDTEGVIGMVRIDRDEDTVWLDAAIRYRINPLDRPSCKG
jgi:hypothetical protein